MKLVSFVIETRQTEINELHEDLFPPQLRIPMSIVSGPSELSDDEVIQKAREAKTFS